MQQTTQAPPNQTIWFDSSVDSSINASWFDADYWHGKNAVTGQAQGRGSTLFFKVADNEFVLRHYQRGGLIGKLVKDKYVYTGLSKTRAWQELSLLLVMLEQGLPVPTPVAARIAKHGLTYTADLITRRIPHAVDVFNLLCKASLDADTWKAIGEAIRAMHDAQIYHHDLNIHNIMRDREGKIWLIDFDKCCQRSGSGWKQGNLDRLLRSLNKEHAKQSDFHFTKSDWQTLMNGYQRV